MIPYLLVVSALFSATQAGQWNVMDYGAVAGPETDNTAAFQRALDAAGASGGGLVAVPAGHYRLDGTISIPIAVTLQGTFHAPPTDRQGEDPKLDGSVLLAYAGRGDPAAAPFIRLTGSMATLSGFIVAYPEWKESDVPPVPYPPTVYASGSINVAVLDCCFLNSYEALHFQDSHRFLVRNVYGYPSCRGLYVDNCLDIGRVENCHFWPFGINYGASAYTQWINENGVAFEFARTDWQYVTNTFCFGYGIGYKFSTTKNGSCNGNFLGIGADCCRRAVLVDTVPNTIDLLITNGEFVGRWGSVDSVGVEIIGQSDARVSLNNCAFWGPLDRAIWSRPLNANLTVNACGFKDWDLGAQDSPAIQIDGGKAIIQGNTFFLEGLHARVGEKAASAIFTANQAPAGLRVINEAGSRTLMTANEVDTLEWPRGAARNYGVWLGDLGDGRYVRGFHSKERARPWHEEGTMRWGGAKPRLVLPVDPGKEYSLTVDVFVPEQALDAQNGLYLGPKRIAELPAKEGAALISATIPPQEHTSVEIAVRAKAWFETSQGVTPNSARPLSVAVRRFTMKARRAPARMFDANRGGWIETADRVE
ncbi:MAG TPA: glycosyl hydrolase family 28-related protein [Candidatus Hydrogenedentes bacterium]|nr:glycosyl hydrolase family 28-related protein [Candidatus Hydrogenedentota bacterium]HQM49052.1 glycosyl hydrolase family 28-related protein [Candidatus Hydrogenedentota bacterium]